MVAAQELDGLASIKVVGVGGGGSNAVNRMIEEGIKGVQFIAVNTDAQALLRSRAPSRIRIGERVTKGLGSGGDPALGLQSAEESREELRALFEGADMVFLTAGMGGGTGTGAVPFIAQLAREAGALTVAVVTRPFSFEGLHRSRVAEEGLQRLREQVDTLIPIPNDRLLQVADKRATVKAAFRQVDEILFQGIQGITDVITIAGDINRDLRDVRSIMKDAGQALMAIGQASGETRASEAARQATSNSLLDIQSIEGARGVLFVMYHDPEFTMHEVFEAAEIITSAAHPEARILWGCVEDPHMEGKLRITVIATGFGRQEGKQQVSPGQDNVRQFPAAPAVEVDQYELPPWMRRVPKMR